MHTFFHGWRRKAGVVTLVIALAALGLWVRTRVACDLFEMRPNDTAIFSLALNQSSIEFNHHWEEAHSGESINRSPKNLFEWSSHATNGNVPIDLWIDYGQWRYFSIETHGGRTSSGQDAYVKVPYLTSVIALTLLSGYLIFYKPPKRA
ncbi:MAG TPA: hypothetical protein VGM98_05610 [Schlesneria sp.]|jgi:hypothetical protein